MEREKRRDTYVHMHRLDHTGPIPLKKEGGRKKKRQTNKVDYSGNVHQLSC